MKEQLKKVFSDPPNFTGSIKEEQTSKSWINFYWKFMLWNLYSKQYNPRFKGNNRYSTNNKDSGNQNSHWRIVNPYNKDGEITKFNVCRSIYHWTKSSADSYENHMKIKEETNIMDTLIEETLSTAVLDSGCTKSLQ